MPSLYASTTPFSTAGYIVLGDCAADDLLAEFVFTAVGFRFHLNHDMAVLAVPAGLFLMFVFRFRGRIVMVSR